MGTFLWLAGWLLGCGGAMHSAPRGAVAAYAQALSAQRYGEAYELMSTEYRREHSKDEFVQMMKDSPTDVRDTVAALRANSRVNVSANLRYGELNDEISLVLEDGQWRLAQHPLSFYPQDTPERALKSLVRAIQNQRYDYVLRFAPDKYRKLMTLAQVREEFEGKNKKHNQELLERLRASLNNKIEQRGNKASMPYGDGERGASVTFLRENGVWKIEDLD